MLKTRSLDCLMPYVRYLALKLKAECAKEGIPLGFANTLRDKEYQEYCYETGKSASKEVGPHAFGLAFDFFINKKGSEYDMTLIRRVGEIGKKLGLEWAGDWKTFKEYVHFEYPTGLTDAELRAGKRVELPAVPEEETMTENEVRAIAAKVVDEKVPRYTYLRDIPKWYAPTVERLVNKGVLAGKSGAGEDLVLDLTEDACRNLVILDRAGVFGE